MNGRSWPNPFADHFIAAAPGKAFKLAKRDPRDQSAFADKEQGQGPDGGGCGRHRRACRTGSLPTAEARLLVVLQGIDCSGKDGTVRAVFNTCGPIGVKVTPFKAPTRGRTRA